MTQREEIKALRDEVAELRKQITALLDVERIMAQQRVTYVPYVPYVPYTPTPTPVWPPQPWITYTGGVDNQCVTQGADVAWIQGGNNVTPGA